MSSDCVSSMVLNGPHVSLHLMFKIIPWSNVSVRIQLRVVGITCVGLRRKETQRIIWLQELWEGRASRKDFQNDTGKLTTGTTASQPGTWEVCRGFHASGVLGRHPPSCSLKTEKPHSQPLAPKLHNALKSHRSKMWTVVTLTETRDTKVKRLVRKITSVQDA